MHLGFFDKKENNPGSLLSGLIYDAENLNSIILGIIGLVIQTLFVSIVALVIGFIYDWRITLVMIIFTPILFVANTVYFEVTNSQNDSNEIYQLEAVQIQSECISNSKTVFGYNYQNNAVSQVINILKTPLKDFNLTSLKYGIL
jgi:ATP-binding cassette subfamily B (MDR/TAP) protein 1